MIKRIFLDLDGVLANFVGAAAKVFGTTEEELFKKWIPGEYDICKVLDISDDDFWSHVILEENYWSEIEPYSWATELYEMCCKIAPTTIATSPCHDPACLSGKVRWMNKNLGNGKPFRDYLIGPRKEMCAAPGHLLIDDSDNQCVKFVENGGDCLLFPAIWNTKHWVKRDGENLISFVKVGLEFCNRVKS